MAAFITTQHALRPVSLLSHLVCKINKFVCVVPLKVFGLKACIITTTTTYRSILEALCHQFLKVLACYDLVLSDIFLFVLFHISCITIHM